MKITEEWLSKRHACTSGVEWFLAQDERDAGRLMIKLTEEGRESESLWLLQRLLQGHRQSVKISIFSAELVLGIYEKEVLNDSRPREAIDAAKGCLMDPCEATIDAAWSARNAAEGAACSARGASSAAASAAACAASCAAEGAACAAECAAESAACAAACAAEIAADGVEWSSVASEPMIKEAQLKIINHAIEVLGL